MAIPPLILRIYADSTGVKKGVAQANAQVNGFRASLARAGKIGALALGVAVVGGTIKAVQAAGDLGEAINAVNVTFGKSSRTVRSWAQQAATSAGLAEAEALQAAAGFGAMLDSAGIAGDTAAEMSVKVAQLAGDIGSLRNADPTEMLERMRAGLAGEAEPLRRFGIFISEARVQTEAYASGIAKAGAELTDAQKIQARYNIILEDSEKAAGDFAETAGESLPNQLRILRAQLINVGAQIGQVLIPIVVKVLGWINRGIEIVGQWARALDRNLGPAFRAVWSVITRDILPALQKLWQAVQPVIRVIGTVLVGALKVVLRVIRAVAASVAFLIDRFADLVNAIKTAWSWLTKAGELTEPVPPVFGGGGFIPRGTPRQRGGWASAGRAYLVGEAGPEIFVPRLSGMVLPNADGGTPVINVYIGEDKVEGVVVRALNKAGRRA